MRWNRTKAILITKNPSHKCSQIEIKRPVYKWNRMIHSEIDLASGANWNKSEWNRIHSVCACNVSSVEKEIKVTWAHNCFLFETKPTYVTWALLPIAIIWKEVEIEWNCIGFKTAVFS